MMEAFDLRFPELASRETRSITVLQPGQGLPPGDYVFREMYCPDPDCDCRNVILQVALIRKDHGRMVATINHALEPGGVHEELGSDPTVLEPFGQQSELAGEILRVAKTTLLADEMYTERLRRHYRIIKGRESPSRPTPRADSSDAIHCALMEVFPEYGKVAFAPVSRPRK